MAETTRHAPRKVGLGMVGGGPGSNIGDTPQIASWQVPGFRLE